MALFRRSGDARKIEVQALDFYTWADGKIVEKHGQPDQLGLMQQIGALPRN